MAQRSEGDVTALLVAARHGDDSALHGLLPILYEDLRARAAAFLSRERPDHTLQPTALLHEAYLRLVDQTRADWHDRSHFLAVAATVIRRILVDHARRHGAARRARDGLPLRDPAGGDAALVDPVELLDLDDALNRLAERDARKARAVELHYFAGLENREAAEVLGVSLPTVERDLKFARAWLQRELGGES